MHVTRKDEAIGKHKSCSKMNSQKYLSTAFWPDCLETWGEKSESSNVMKALQAGVKSVNLMLKTIEEECTAKARIQQNLFSFQNCMSTKSLKI